PSLNSTHGSGPTESRGFFSMVDARGRFGGDWSWLQMRELTAITNTTAFRIFMSAVSIPNNFGILRCETRNVIAYSTEGLLLAKIGLTHRFRLEYLFFGQTFPRRSTRHGQSTKP